MRERNGGLNVRSEEKCVAFFTVSQVYTEKPVSFSSFRQHCCSSNVSACFILCTYFLSSFYCVTFISICCNGCIDVRLTHVMNITYLMFLPLVTSGNKVGLNWLICCEILYVNWLRFNDRMIGKNVNNFWQ